MIQKEGVLGGRRALIVTHPKAIKGIIVNPTTRTDHPNPREELFRSFDSRIGIMMPPIDDPDMTTPKAAARFLSKYCDTAAIAGNCRKPITMPIMIPCTRINCQYSLHRLSIITAKT